MPSRSRPGRLGEEVERLLGAAGQQHRVVLCLELLGRDRLADVHVAMEGHALGFHLLHAAVDDALLHLEVGDAVDAAARRAWRSSRRRARHGRRARAAARRRGRPGPSRRSAIFLPVFVSGGCGATQPSSKRAVGDRALDRLDGDRHVVDVERAGRFARRRANAARHLGEVVGRVQVLRRLLPVAVVDEVVPVRDLVVDRAAVVTIGDAAVHAAGCLVLRRPSRSAARTNSRQCFTRSSTGAYLRSARLNSRNPSACPFPFPISGARARMALTPSPRRSFHGEAKSFKPWPLEADVDLRRPSLSAACALAISASALRYSTGMTFLNFGRYARQSARMAFAFAELV